MSAAGVFKAGGTGTFTIGVTDDKDAGPATGPVTSTFDVPDWMTFTPGGLYPPILVRVAVPYGTRDQMITPKVTTARPVDRS